MLVYWKEEIDGAIEENFGKIVGAYGNDSKFFKTGMLVVAMDNGGFKSVSIDKCYHKKNINEG